MWVPGEATGASVGLPPGGGAGVGQGVRPSPRAPNCIMNTVKAPCFLGSSAGLWARYGHKLVKDPLGLHGFGLDHWLGPLGLLAPHAVNAFLQFGRRHLMRFLRVGPVLRHA